MSPSIAEILYVVGEIERTMNRKRHWRENCFVKFYDDQSGNVSRGDPADCENVEELFEFETVNEFFRAAETFLENLKGEPNV